MDTKRCSKCKVDHSVDQFLWIKRHGKSVLSSWCRGCRTAAAREQRAARPQVYRAADQRRYAGRSESPKYREYQAAYKRGRRKTEEGKREVRGFRLRLYGLTHDDYDQMLINQDGHCALCPAVPPEGAYLHIDHCHATGRVRKLLCPACNRGLGAFGDDLDRLLRAVDYLREFAVA